MRKTIAIILLLIFLMPLNIAGSEEIPLFSVDAARQFVDLWNNYHAKYYPEYYCGYGLMDDKKTLNSFSISYNLEHNNVGYASELIPDDAELYFTCFPVTANYGFGVFSDHMPENLEKVVVYTDDRVINDALVYSSHDPQDLWSVVLPFEEMLELYNSDQFAIKLTVDGKSEVIDVKLDEKPYLYDLISWLIKAQLYTDTTYEKYLSAEFLPGGVRSTPTPEGFHAKGYSFRDDIDGMNKAAGSVFFVGVYDANADLIGTASGFVAFDEHLFVTNQHVIDGASYLAIVDDSEDENIYILDQVIASDKYKDIAILNFPEGENYDALPLNIEEDCQRGQPIVAIGSPEGLKNTLSKGDISAIREEDGTKLIQISASISHGSSGGALFDDNGKVIGITSSGYEEGQNLNFAISIKAVQDIYDRWDKKSYEQLGSARSWNMVGITPTPSPSPSPTPTPTPSPSPTPSPTPTPSPVPTPEPKIEDEPGNVQYAYNIIRGNTDENILGFTSKYDYAFYSGQKVTGEYVTNVFKSSEASVAGLRIADLIVAADKTVIDSNVALARFLADKEYKDAIHFQIYRAGRPMTIIYVMRSKIEETPSPASTPIPTSTPTPAPTQTYQPKAKISEVGSDKNNSGSGYVTTPVTAVKLSSNYDPKVSYLVKVNDPTVISNVFTVEPVNASKDELNYVVYKEGKVTKSGYSIKKTKRQSIEAKTIRPTDSITFTEPGLYTVEAISTDGTNKSAKISLSVYPEDMMSLSFGSVSWEQIGNDQVSLVFDIKNAEYGIAVSAFEIYVYATDVWGNRIYGETTVYYGTTEKRVDPGKTVKSDKFVVPQWSKVSKLYCGIHKIKFRDKAGTIKTYDNPHYVWYDFSNKH